MLYNSCKTASRGVFGCRSHADWAHMKHPGKPLLVGEVGASGLVGFRSPGPHAKWSEDLQARIMQASILAIFRESILEALFTFEFVCV